MRLSLYFPIFTHASSSLNYFYLSSSAMSRARSFLSASYSRSLRDQGMAVADFGFLGRNESDVTPTEATPPSPGRIPRAGEAGTSVGERLKRLRRRRKKRTKRPRRVILIGCRNSNHTLHVFSVFEETNERDFGQN